ncbi:unnamed protein product [Microthlaspi erraticum]|uniref:TAZ-type domain-containing protein n=1 Tax=Microthlaspi erraticum TaxID=1685480 RepID=A0A6D2I7H8_9BRAS|nr:unnamed protein product [Microthlaspi erraticum]
MNVLQLSQLQKSNVSPPHQNSFNMSLRRDMRKRIYAILLRKHPSESQDVPSRKKFIYLAKFLENKLMTSAKSEEEYSDLRDLEARMCFIMREIKRLSSQRRAAATPTPSSLCEGQSMRNAVSCGSSSLFRFVTPSGSLPVSQDTSPLNPNPMPRVESNQARDIERQGQHVYDRCSSARASISCCQTVFPRSNTERDSSEEVKRDCSRHCMMQKKWLRFLLHVLRCSAAEVKCDGEQCIAMRKIIKTTQSTKPPLRLDRYCPETRRLILQIEQCRDKMTGTFN